MFFLQINNPNFTDYVQAWSAIANVVLALASVIIAFFVYWQGKKIKELSDIVIQLERQTKTMNNSFAIERLTTIHERMPFFTPIGYNDADPNWVDIQLTNIGKEARDIQWINKSKEEMDIIIPYGAVSTGGQLNIKIIFKNQENDGYNFTFCFRSHLGFISHQTFYKNMHENYRIDPPHDFIVND